MPIQNLEGGDIVNQGVDKINESLGEIPVSFDLSPDGNLIITKHNAETQIVPLKNVFSVLGTVFSSLAVAMATPQVAGKVLLVDSSRPTDFQSSSRVLSASQVADLIQLALKVTLQEVTNAGYKTTGFLQADGGYAMTQFPQIPSPTGVAVIGPKPLTVGSAPITLPVVGEQGYEELAAILKPFILSSTPSDGPVVANPIADITVTASGDQHVVIPTNTFTGADKYSATKQDGSPLPISFISSSLWFSLPANFANQTIPIKLTGSNTNSGKSASVNFNIIVDRVESVQLPFIISILRKYNNNLLTDYYLIKSSYQGLDLAQTAVWRCRRSDESSWRSDFGALDPTDGVFSNDLINQGYKLYASAGIGGVGATVIFQFKPYRDAPDSTIIERSYTHTSAADLGTEVYNIGSVGSKVTGAWIKRIAGTSLLSLYAQGTGVIKTTIVATGSTPVYVNGERAMLTEAGGYASPENFSGSVKYGSLYGKTGEQAVVNGSYIVSFIDEDGKGPSTTVNINDTGPIATILVPTIDPGTGGGDNTTPVAGDQSSYGVTSTFN